MTERRETSSTQDQQELRLLALPVLVCVVLAAAVIWLPPLPTSSGERSQARERFPPLSFVPVGPPPFRRLGLETKIGTDALRALQSSRR
jgi:hypothetical protein